MKHVVWLLVLAAGLVGSAAGGAEPMAAEELFDAGVALMEAGDFGTACPKIAESQRLEPRAGTLFTLAECWARVGRVATATARYKEYLRIFERMSDADRGAQRGRDAIAKRQIDELEPRMARLKLDPQGSWPDDVVVELNGVALGAPSLGLALPTDPGEQRIVTRVPGGPTSHFVVTVAEGEQRDVDISVKLAPEPSPPSSKTAPLPAPVAPDDASSEAGMHPLTIAGWSLGSVAGGALIAGVVLGAVVLSRGPEIDAACSTEGEPRICSPEGAELAEETQRLAHGSTASFVIAGALGAAAAAFFIFGDQATQVSVGPTGLLLRGRF